jgi:hypothetical protein
LCAAGISIPIGAKYNNIETIFEGTVGRLNV